MRLITLGIFLAALAAFHHFLLDGVWQWKDVGHLLMGACGSLLASLAMFLVLFTIVPCVLFCYDFPQFHIRLGRQSASADRSDDLLQEEEGAGAAAYNVRAATWCFCVMLALIVAPAVQEQEGMPQDN